MTDGQGWGEAPLELTDTVEVPPPVQPKVTTEKYGDHVEMAVLVDKPKQAVVKLDYHISDVKKRNLPLPDFFRNSVVETGIDYSRFDQVALVCAVQGMTFFTGSLLNPKKMDPGRKERAWRQVKLDPVGKK